MDIERYVSEAFGVLVSREVYYDRGRGVGTC
jgi:hypothetical protein